MVMICSKYNDIREDMLQRLLLHMNDSDKATYNNLTDILKCYVLLGMEFPLHSIWQIRVIACTFIRKMYKRRVSA